MSARRKSRRPLTLASQRGQAAIIALLLIIGMGVTILVYNFPTPAKFSIERDKITAEALAQAKVALIGWSAARTPTALSPNARPGELPCPDSDNSGTDAGACAAGAIGRIPWKSLGIPEPKDSSGETLWYAIAGPFRNHGMVSTPITSDTLGNMTVYVNSSATTLTNQAVAVIFSPGALLGTQNRHSSTTASCATTGTTIARNLCATNYLDLDTASSINNATPTTNASPPSFIQVQPSSTFNDRVLAITNADLMPLVEQRVAREMRTLLEAYRAATTVYPWADLSTGSSDLGLTRGRFPCNTTATGALPVPWGNVLPATPSLPAWLTNGCGVNGWASVIYYAAAQATTLCSDLTLTLSVNGVCGTSLVLLTPGGYTGNPVRNWPNTVGTAITGYFEDGENSDNNDDRYVTPTSNVYNRDRIFTNP